MFLTWWMISILGVAWFVSLWHHGYTSFKSGFVTAITTLEDEGYIEIDENGDINKG